MKRFKEFIGEAFNRPAKWRWKEYDDLVAIAEFKSDEFQYKVMFGCYRRREEWEVEFYPTSGRPHGKVSSLEVITTVMDIIKDFIKKKDPKLLTFIAAKPGSGDKLNRSSLYKKLVKKYIPTNKYNTSIKDDDYSSVIYFYIKRKK